VPLKFVLRLAVSIEDKLFHDGGLAVPSDLRQPGLRTRDETISIGKKALAEGYPGVVWANVPKFDLFRDDPRFQALLLRMNLEP